MKTIKELREFFECSEAQALSLLTLHEAGLNHGRLGWYQDGIISGNEFDNGLALDIARLEQVLDVIDNSVFNIYQDAHTEGLAEYERSKNYQDGETN